MSQAMEALAKANEIRYARAELRAKVASGEVAVGDILLDPPDFLSPSKYRSSCGPTVMEVLSWQRGWGLLRASKLLNDLELSHSLRPIDLSPATAVEIDDALRGKGVDP